VITSRVHNRKATDDDPAAHAVTAISLPEPIVGDRRTQLGCLTRRLATRSRLSLHRAEPPRGIW
jgi:hypothetical protein